MSVIKINNDELVACLSRAASAMADTTPLCAAIAQSFAVVTEDNFELGGRPSWAGRSPVTIEIYRKQGLSYGGVLQLTGTLRSRIVTGFSRDEASIGSNMKYAAIQHFGGMAGRGRKVMLPSRPYLPMDKDGALQVEAEREVERDALTFWQAAFD